MPQYQFEQEWVEGDSLPGWVLRGRKSLNIVIRDFNEWQIAGFPPERSRSVLARIEWGKVQCDEDGGSEWINVLNRMKEFVDANC